MQSAKTEYVVQVLVGTDWVDFEKHDTPGAALRGADVEAKRGFYARVNMRAAKPTPPTGGPRPPLDYPEQPVAFHSDMGEPLTKQEKITALVYVLIVLAMFGLSAWLG